MTWLVLALATPPPPPGPLAGTAALELASLEAAVGSPLVYQNDPRGGLRYLAGEAIAPSCSALASALELSSAEIAIRCFFTATQALFADGGEDPASVPWFIAALTPQSQDGFQTIRVRQGQPGLPIRGGELVFVARWGALVSVLGHLEPPGRVAGLASSLPAPTAELTAAVEVALGERVTARRRWFDPDAQENVLEFETRTHDLVRFGEESRQILGRTPLRLDYNLVQKNTSVANYTIYEEDSGSQTRSIAVDWRVHAFTADAALDYASEANPEHGEPYVCHATGGDDDDECSGAAYQTVPNNATSVWTGYPSVEGQMMNAYFWVHDLAVFANSSAAAINAYIPWPSNTVANLKVVVANGDVCDGNSGCTRPNYDLFQSTVEFQIALPIPQEAPRSLETMAHEYGHFIHGAYDFWPDTSDFSALSLAEGFAEHNLLRYAMFRRNATGRPHDSPFSVSYGQQLTNSSPKEYAIKPYFQNGQAYPWAYADQDSTIDQTQYIYRPWVPGTACNTQSNPYNCGAPIGTVYWTLAWNTLRVGYSQRAAGTPLLYQSAWTANPEGLANRAYTYAITNMPSNGTVQDFFTRVSERYYQWQLEGVINGEENHRINQALTVHCVGWSAATCQQWHRTAWHPLAAAMVDQQTFSMGPQLGYSSIRHFARAEDTAKVARYGTPVRKAIGTPDGLGYMRLDSSNDFLCITTNFPLAGTYKLSIAFRETVAGTATLRFAIGNSILGPYQDWVLPESSGGFVWAHYSPAVAGITAGTRSACIQRKNQDVDIDAILISKQ